jgi:hypothetical protein
MADNLRTMTETVLRPGAVAGPALGSGSGGGGWVDDEDPDGWWGWSEEPGDDEPPYRGSRLRRAVALVTAAAVVAGSMTLVAVVAVGPSAPQYAVGAVHLGTASRVRSGGAPTVTVRFVVTNTSPAAGRAHCSVLVGDPAHPAATATLTTPRLLSGGSMTELARVRLNGAPRGEVEARCGAAGGG